MIYKIRIILDVDDNVIRDIAIDATNTLEDLHYAINEAFGFSGTEMASFYLSDAEWNQGEEFPLFDMSEIPGEVIQMREISLGEVMVRPGDKLIYVYDFIFMWTFYVELIEVLEDGAFKLLPQLVFSLGEVPEEAPQKTFKSDQTEFGLDTDEDGDLYFDADEYWE